MEWVTFGFFWFIFGSLGAHIENKENEISKKKFYFYYLPFGLSVFATIVIEKMLNWLWFGFLDHSLKLRALKLQKNKKGKKHVRRSRR